MRVKIFAFGQDQCSIFNMIDANFAEKLRKCVRSSVVLDVLVLNRDKSLPMMYIQVQSINFIKRYEL